MHGYATVGLTLRSHPLALLRHHLNKRRLLTAEDLEKMPNGRVVRYAGIVTVRQQPETAKGTIFINLEGETGNVQDFDAASCCRTQRPNNFAGHPLVQGRYAAFGRGRHHATAPEVSFRIHSPYCDTRAKTANRYGV